MLFYAYDDYDDKNVVYDNNIDVLACLCTKRDASPGPIFDLILWVSSGYLGTVWGLTITNKASLIVTNKCTCILVFE